MDLESLYANLILSQKLSKHFLKKGMFTVLANIKKMANIHIGRLHLYCPVLVTDKQKYRNCYPYMESDGTANVTYANTLYGCFILQIAYIQK